MTINPKYTYTKISLRFIIDQWNPGTVIYNRAVLVAVTSECFVKSDICKDLAFNEIPSFRNFSEIGFSISC